MTMKVNSRLVPYHLFSGGEIRLKLPETVLNLFSGKDIALQVEATLHSSEEVMALVMLTYALKEHFGPYKSMELTIPYFPYARQDRVCDIGEAHSLKAMCHLINNLDYDKVIVYDPHSDVLPALLENCRVVKQHHLVQRLVGNKLKKYSFVSPDAGAEKKVLALAKATSAWGLYQEVVYATKERNPVNGQITATHFRGNVQGKDLLIVDDICDGGRTFIELAKKLKEAGAATVELYVTHGIFSAGLGPLKEHLDHVYCWHSFRDYNDTFLTVKDQDNA